MKSTGITYCGITNNSEQRGEATSPMLVVRTGGGSLRYAPLGEAQLLDIIKSAVQMLDLIRRDRVEAQR